MPEWTNSCHPHEPKRHTQTDHFNLTKHTHGAGSPGEQSGAHRAAFRVAPLECNGYAPSATSIATSRHHPYGTYVQSASTAWQGDAGRGISGLTCQHHWMRRMNVRDDTPSIATDCASLIRSVAQTRTRGIRRLTALCRRPRCSRGGVCIATAACPRMSSRSCA